MIISVKIKQKGLFKKPLPLEVILGKELKYGSYGTGWVLKEGKCAGDGVTVYHPAHIARGFGVGWTPEEENEITLTLSCPTTAEELGVFFATVKRITEEWNCSLEVGDQPVTPEEFLAALPDAVKKNREEITALVEEVAGEEEGGVLILSALWPLIFSQKEARETQEDPDFFGRWLHEKQALEAFYDVPLFRKSKGSIVGRYAFPDGVAVILPKKPYVPSDVVNKKTGKPITCNTYEVSVYSQMQDSVLGVFSYDRLLSLIPERKISEFDAGHYLIDAFSNEESQNLVNELYKYRLIHGDN